MEVTEKGGPSDTTQRRVEAGEPFSISQSTLRKYDQGLNWRDGAAAGLLSSSPSLATVEAQTARRSEAQRQAEHVLQETTDSLRRLLNPLMTVVERTSMILQDPAVSQDVRDQALESVIPAVIALVDHLPLIVKEFPMESQIAVVTAVAQHARGEGSAPEVSRADAARIEEIHERHLDVVERLDGIQLPSRRRVDSDEA